MRLINVHNLAFEEFEGEENIPKYAILSHRWEQEEVLFKHWGTLDAYKRKGYAKSSKVLREYPSERS